MRIVFMGTPQFAHETLRALCEHGQPFETVGVITQTDKPKGRGNVLTPSVVKVYAQQLGIPCYQPQTLRCEQTQQLIRDMKPDCIVVSAYGKLLPPQVLEIPALGCINVHGSLLPKYRGAAPIQRSIMNGETKTGVTIMRMAEGIDNGDILLTRQTEIGEDMNYGELSGILAAEGAQLLIKALLLLQSGELQPVPQNEAEATYAAKIDKSQLRLDFTSSAKTLHNKIRGVYPALCAYACQQTKKGEKTVKLVRSSYSEQASPGEAGEVVLCDMRKGEIHIACAQGTLIVKELIPPGKASMSAADYIRGRQISCEDRFV